MQVVLEEDIELTEDSRLIRRLYKVQPDSKFPEGLKFAYQYLLLKSGAWIEVCRIDNYTHEKHRIGTHVHKYGKGEVEFVELNFVEAREYILELGERLSEKLRWSDDKD